MRMPLENCLRACCLAVILAGAIAACQPPPSPQYQPGYEPVTLTCHHHGAVVLQKEVSEVWVTNGSVYSYKLDGKIYSLSTSGTAFCFTTPKAPELFVSRE